MTFSNVSANSLFTLFVYHRTYVSLYFYKAFNWFSLISISGYGYLSIPCSYSLNTCMLHIYNSLESMCHSYIAHPCSSIFFFAFRMQVIDNLSHCHIIVLNYTVTPLGCMYLIFVLFMFPIYFHILDCMFSYSYFTTTEILSVHRK